MTAVSDARGVAAQPVEGSGDRDAGFVHRRPESREGVGEGLIDVARALEGRRDDLLTCRASEANVSARMVTETIRAPPVATSEAEVRPSPRRPRIAHERSEGRGEDGREDDGHDDEGDEEDELGRRRATRMAMRRRQLHCPSRSSQTGTNAPSVLGAVELSARTTAPVIAEIGERDGNREEQAEDPGDRRADRQGDEDRHRVEDAQAARATGRRRISAAT